jgi:hypothetical protein
MSHPLADLLTGAGTRIANENLFLEQEFEKEKAEGFPKRIQKTLLEIGVPPRTTKGTMERIPRLLYNRQAFQSFPESCFGIIGPTGCGKSCALAVCLKELLRQELAEAGPTKMEEASEFGGNIIHRIEPRLRTDIMWVSWPAYSRRMKGLSARRLWDDKDASVQQLIIWATAYPDRILILDDIGEETIKENAYTTEELENLIDALYNNDAKLFWTSNHTVEQMSEPNYYGPRLISRLIGLAPAIELPPDLPDLRLA